MSLGKGSYAEFGKPVGNLTLHDYAEKMQKAWGPEPMNDAFEESKHPRAENGQFGKGSGNKSFTEKGAMEHLQNLAAEKARQKRGDLTPVEQAKANVNKFRHRMVVAKTPGEKARWKREYTAASQAWAAAKSAEEKSRQDPMTDAFEESKHPRAENGQFGEGGKEPTQAQKREKIKKIEGLSKSEAKELLHSKSRGALERRRNRFESEREKPLSYPK